MSLVYVTDVADVIMKLLDPKPEVLNQAFNLAFKETPTLLEVLTDMKVGVLRCSIRCSILYWKGSLLLVIS